jgi:hypothetical protein
LLLNSMHLNLASIVNWEEEMRGDVNPVCG